jgi:hypothetical protein
MGGRLSWLISEGGLRIRLRRMKRGTKALELPINCNIAATITYTVTETKRPCGI